jgi:hypothetical protein
MADGSASHPYPTLEAAHDALRKRRRKNVAGEPIAIRPDTSADMQDQEAGAELN